MTKRLCSVIGLVGVLAAGCDSAPAHTASKPVVAPSPIASPAVPSPTPAPARPAVAKATDPLTGLAPRHTPIVVIKVDNATTARRYQRGLGHAAIVYQELVESGQTRFAAVFDNAYAGEVGPIRSVRETDLELLPQYGRVAVAFSGGNRGSKGQFRSAVRAGALLDASYDVLPGDYRLGEQRVDARNFFSTPARLAVAANGATPTDIGLRFGPLVGGTRAPAATVPFSDMMVVGVRYRGDGSYAILQDGTTMPAVAPTNVVIQYVPIKRGRYVDVLGAPSPYSITLGQGNAVILRDGRMLHATWKRATTTSGTHYLDGHGHDVALKAGSTWVLLVPDSRTASIG
ncbi:MAG: hypothetical protein NVS3B26_19310 [Mycobacteriales bacterium]